VWVLEQSRGDGQRSLMTPERVLCKYCEYNKGLIFFQIKLNTHGDQIKHPWRKFISNTAREGGINTISICES